ncbi:MAG: hypothetical protein IJR52_02470 [Selenomonadaceae bacterium]|nr:hypothetical protein [Selenomonadaceae bacterium]
MGYSEKLEQSMKNFDREVDKLTKINDLVKEIDGLTEIFLEESKDFQDSVKRLTELKAGVEKDCALLSKFTANETAARQKLLADVHNTVTEDAQKIIDGLTELLGSVESALNETVKNLDALTAAHKNSQGKFLSDTENLLDTFTDTETAARQKLLADVHENIITDARQIINDISEPLNVTNAKLNETCKEIDGFITLHKKSQEKFLSDTENLLVKYNTKNLETYNNLLTALSNKIDIAKGSVEKILANQENLLAELSRTSDKNKRELEKSLTAKLEEQNQKLSEEVATLKEKISVLSYIKAATTAAVGFGILSCIINFIK